MGCSASVKMFNLESDGRNSVAERGLKVVISQAGTFINYFPIYFSTGTQ